MRHEFNRCTYCEHLTPVDYWTSACPEAYAAARDAGLPVAGRVVNGQTMLPVDADEDAGRLCERFSLMPYADMVAEFGAEIADAAHEPEYLPGERHQPHVAA